MISKGLLIRSFYLITGMLILSFHAVAQKSITKSIKEFGAKGDGFTDDHDAFVKAAAFFNNRNGNGKLVIPKGIYIVGRQQFYGKANKEKNITYLGEHVLHFENCKNLVIEGRSGAVLQHRDSMRIGTFSPATGKPFKHEIKDININPDYYGYASNAGNMVYFSNSSNICISGLKLNGNTDHFSFGGNWGAGRNAFELIHYGIYILDSHDIEIKNCQIENFAVDGIYVANLGSELKTFKINIDNCKVNYSGRNGLSWLGGEGIRVTNSAFSNSGQGIVQESPSAGIDIEVENSSFCRNGYFYNCIMENNIGSAIASGSKDLSSNVLFKKCVAASPGYYTVFADAASHVFEDCKLYGTVLVWYKATGEADAVKFKKCLFEENYKGKKMYDGTYQLGIEATAVEVDSCIFRAYTTASYYLAGQKKDCSPSNLLKLRFTNNNIYNYCDTGFRLAEKVAGMAGYTVFYNNKFFALPGVSFQNWFNANCFADAGKNVFTTINKK